MTPRKSLRSSTSARFRVGAGLALLAFLAPTATPLAAEAAQPMLSLHVPAVAQVGDTVRVEVVATHAPALAAYEATIALPDAVGSPSLAGGADVLPGADGPATHLPLVQGDARLSLGAWSCTGPACPAAAQPRGDRLVVAAVDVVLSRPGRVQLDLGEVAGYGADGSRIPLGVSAPAIVQVSGGTEALQAPGIAPVKPSSHGATRPATDLTGDGRTSSLDAAAATRDWLTARESGGACLAAASEDSCASVAQVQSLAAQMSPAPAAVAVAPTVFVVDSAGDEGDAVHDKKCATAAGKCTLRAAIGQSNNMNSPVRVEFAIPTAAPGGVARINLGRRVDFYNPAGVVVDGYTQPGASPNTASNVSNARIRVEIVGTGFGVSDGFFVASPNNTFRGLSMHSMMREIWFLGADAANNRVLGNFLCTDPSGTVKSSIVKAGASGVAITAAAHDNIVGTSDPADRNVTSGCPHHGIVLVDSGTVRNVLQGNTVGLTPDGTARLTNGSHGIDLNQGTSYTMVGGSRPGEGNLVSGNMQEGIEVSHGSNTVNNSVIGNLVGTDPTGTAAPAYAANRMRGIRLEGAASCTTCPPDAGGSLVSGNVVVSSGLGGILVDKGQHDNVVRDNLIGLTKDGTPAGNAYYGIRIEKGATGNTVGPGNEIAYNRAGIQIQPTGSEPVESTAAVTARNRITRNQLHDNVAGPGIDLAPLYSTNSAGATPATTNAGIDAPVLAGATPVSVAGTTCAACVVEVYTADQAALSAGWRVGSTFLAAATADSSGAFQVPLDPASTPRSVVATATDPDGNTSEFSASRVVPAAAEGNAPPKVSLVADCSGGSCTFDGSATTDQDDGSSQLRFEWDLGDGATAVGAVQRHRYLAGGEILVRLVVTDPRGGSSSSTRTLSIVPREPVASFTSTCRYGNCVLDAADSESPDGALVSWSWSFDDGTTATGRRVERSWSTPGSRAVTLTVRDDAGLTATATDSVLVPSPPVGLVASDTFERTLATSWGSADVGGRWTHAPNATTVFSTSGGSGRSTSGATYARTSLLPAVSVRDVAVSSSFSLSEVPSASAGMTVALLLRRAADSTRYQGRVRLLPDGSVRLAVTKQVGSAQDAAIGAEVVVPRAAPAAAGRTWMLRVEAEGAAPTTLRARVWPAGTPEPTTWDVVRTDSQPELQVAGAVGIYSYQAGPSGPVGLTFDDFTARSRTNAAPAAVFASTCAGSTCSFDATASSDTDGSIASWRWQFPDGGSAEGSQVEHTFPGPGEHTVALSVTDDEGASAVTTSVVSVAPEQEPDEPPVAAFTYTCGGSSCVFDGSGSTDPEGGELSYSWTFGDGSGASGVQAAHAYAAAGPYEVMLTVTDAGGLSDSIGRTVQVQRPFIALDGFERSVTGGWGTADVGGAWVLSPSAPFSVQAGEGQLASGSTWSRKGYLQGVSARDVDLTTSFRASAVPNGTAGLTFSTLLRRSETNTHYQGRVRLLPDGTVRLAVSRNVASAQDRIIGSEVVVPRLTASADQRYLLRVQATGSAPTTLRARVWATGVAEPTTWDVQVQDATPELAGAGSVGLYTYQAQSSGPLVIKMDDFEVRHLDVDSSGAGA